MSINLKVKKVKDVLSFIMNKSGINYFGYLGYDNLGDEALYVATNKLFDEDLAYKPKIPNWLFPNLINNKSFNLVILGGGTLICQELNGYGSNKFGLPFKTDFENAIKNSKTIIVFGTGVDEHHEGIYVDNWLSEWKEILFRASYVSCRGPRSQKILQHIGVSAEVIGDPALSLIKPEGYWSPNCRTMGVNVRPFKYDSDIENNYLEQMIIFLQGKINDGWNVEFLAVSEMDIVTIESVIKGLNSYSPVIHRIYNDPEEYFNIVKRYQVFFGVRLHAVILAMCAGVPSVMLSYRRKCDDFSESVSMEYLNIRLEDIDIPKLDGVLEIMVNNGKEISAEILNVFNEFKTLQKIRVDELRIL